MHPYKPAKLAVKQIEQKKRDEIRGEFETWHAGWKDCVDEKPRTPPPGFDELESESYRTGYAACRREAARVGGQLDEIRALPERK